MTKSDIELHIRICFSLRRSQLLRDWLQEHHNLKSYAFRKHRAAIQRAKQDIADKLSSLSEAELQTLKAFDNFDNDMNLVLG